MLKPSSKKRTLFFIFFDILISLFTLFLAYNLRFSFEVPSLFIDTFIDFFLLILSLKIGFLIYFKIYKVTWRFFALSEAKKLFYAHLFAYGMFGLIYIIFLNDIIFPRSIIIIDFFLSFVFLGFLRISKRLIIENEKNTHLKKTLILGATEFSQTIIKQRKEFYISAIIDVKNSEMLLGSYISNIEVQPLERLESIIELEKIECVLIATAIDQSLLNEIYTRLKKLNIFDVQIAFFGEQENAVIKNLSVEDLLARHPKDLDKTAIKEFIYNKTILITGAGGSIGSEISRQCAIFGAKHLILLDHSEYNLYTLAEELSFYEPSLVMQSVVNKELLEKTFTTYKPQIVIHAAAYKHVPLVEENITESILNNIIGTKNTIDCSIANNVEKFVLISTDKAVRPTNVMGATKRICELYAQNVVSNISNTTEIVSVRFGNVLGSSGSVIPKFKLQIENGGPITVTDPNITRYFMLIPEACELVLQAASLAKGGEIFILDMGEPIKIIDLAKKMIELSGKENIEIKYTGLRAGEKLYEELLLHSAQSTTKYESIFVGEKTTYDINKLNNDIQELLYTSDVLKKVKDIVPEFNHQANKNLF